MAAQITTFAAPAALEQATAVCRRLGIVYDLVSPEPGYARVGVPGLLVDDDVPGRLSAEASGEVLASGWVDHRAPSSSIPSRPPPDFSEDVFGRPGIVVLAPCVADVRKLRLIAHTGGDLALAMPYLNAELPQAMYTAETQTLTLMDGYRMISLYPNRITIAKADDLVDAWRVLENLRCQINGVWARRAAIAPCHESRRKPPALEIFRRLPGTSCRQCGEKTCMAFALRLWSGEVSPTACSPVFNGPYGHLKEPLLAVCTGMGYAGMSAP